MDYSIRRLTKNDFPMYRTHIDSDIDYDFFNAFMDFSANNHQIYILIVDGEIASSGTLLLEYKLTHGGCKCAHIENILTEEKFRGNGYAKLLIDKLISEAKRQMCYRVDLICFEYLIDMYRDRGFEVSEQNAMSIKFPENYKENH